jgi:DNA-binding winged helix-turn-helix (wHTH) protein
MLTQGSIRFDLQKRRVTLADKLVDLSPKEYELACYLFSNRGRVISNSELMTSIWSLPPGMDTRRIDTAACRVRKKLGLNAADGWELRRLRRVGYLLVQVEADQAVIGSNSVDAFQPPSADSQSAGSYGTTSNRRSGADHEKIAIAAIELASNTC